MYPIGFEPMTYRLKGDCSTRLSYGYKIQMTILSERKHRHLQKKEESIPPIIQNNEHFATITNTPSGYLHIRNDIQPRYSCN